MMAFVEFVHMKSASDVCLLCVNKLLLSIYLEHTQTDKNTE